MSAGVAWSLLDGSGHELCLNGTVSGFHSKDLEHDIRTNIADAVKLIISVEPNIYSFKLSELLRAIADSNINEIEILPFFPVEVKNPEWDEWRKCWHGKIRYTGLSGVATRVNRCLTSIFVEGRPRLICISSANLDGRTIALSNLFDNSELLKYVYELSYTNKRIAVSPIQESVQEQLPKINIVGEIIDYKILNDIEDLNAWMQRNRRIGIISSILFVDMQMLSHAIKRRDTDEFVHHISHRLESEDIYPTDTFASLSGWGLSESRTFGEYNRIVYERKTHEESRVSLSNLKDYYLPNDTDD